VFQRNDSPYGLFWFALRIWSKQSTVMGKRKWGRKCLERSLAREERRPESLFVAAAAMLPVPLVPVPLVPVPLVPANLHIS